MALRFLLAAALVPATACAEEPDTTVSAFGLNLTGMVDQLSKTFEPTPEECKHGEIDPITNQCRCFEDWAKAGITHPWEFVEGICEQYKCQSDAKCEEVLGVPGASCPVKGWNCYCGWSWAFSNSGHGWENRHGQCMGLSYTFSISTGLVMEAIMTRLWMIFPPLALLLLPFGRKRAICDHHKPSLWNRIRKCCGMPSQCQGECVASNGYTLDTLKDDFAWTLFVLEVGIWLYVFLAIVWILTLFTWSIFLWAFVLIMLACWAVSACLICLCSCTGACALGDGDGPGFDCSPSDCAPCEGSEEGCCMQCAECCFKPSVVDPYGPSFAEALMMGGPYPCDPFWGYRGYGVAGRQGAYGEIDCACSCCDFCCRCFEECCPTESHRCGCRCKGPWCIMVPLASVIYVMPAMPENAWGGLFGFLMGTHLFSPQCWLYAGGNPFVEFMSMSWLRRADLHDDLVWRDQVYQFLVGETGGVTEEGGAGGQSSDSDSSGSMLQPVTGIGGARVMRVDRPFHLRADGCAPSSFEDYKQNECWICRESCDEWDQWLSCHHLFCCRCSSEMLRRRMPCPLCRVASSTVLRGCAYSLGEVESESGSESGSQSGSEPALGPKMLLGSRPSRELKLAA